MTGSPLRTVIVFLALLALQLLVFSHVDLLGYLNPSVYILFILLYPADGSRLYLLLSAFLMGWIVDIYLNTGGIHAAASVLLAFSRPLWQRLAFGSAIRQPGARVSRMDRGAIVVYFLLVVPVHQITVYILSYFSWNNLLLVARDVLYGSTLTFVLTLSIYLLFTKPRRI